MNDDEVTNLAAIFGDVSAISSSLASCTITTTRGEVGTLLRRVLQAFPGAGLRAWQELNRWYRPKSAFEGAASMANIIAPSRAKSIGELQQSIMDREHRVVAHSKTQRIRPRYRQLRSTREDDDGRDGKTIHRWIQHVR